MNSNRQRRIVRYVIVGSVLAWMATQIAMVPFAGLHGSSVFQLAGTLVLVTLLICLLRRLGLSAPVQDDGEVADEVSGPTGLVSLEIVALSVVLLLLLVYPEGQ